MPGYLIPSDLDRMIPASATNPLQWAEKNLLASPGALVMDATGRTFRIQTLVPATKSDGSCIYLTEDERCAIHADAPFGCAFFGHGDVTKQMALSAKGLIQIQGAQLTGLYGVIWRHLHAKGLRQVKPDELRARMKAT